MKNLIISLLILLTQSSCDKFVRHEYYIKFQNNSFQKIDCYAAYILPDTMLPLDKPRLIEMLSTKTGYIYGSDFNDPDFKRLKTEKLTIFVLNKDTVDRNTWNYIRINYKILKKYEVTEKDIINMGGSVSYP